MGQHFSAEIRFLDRPHRWVLNKRVHGYENEKLQTRGNQIVAAESNVSMAANKQQTFAQDTRHYISSRSDKNEFIRHS
jgi:hypothetical protein